MNGMDNKTKLFLVLPLVIAAALSAAAYRIPFGTGLNNPESEIISFTPRELQISKRPALSVARGLHGPFDFSAAEAGGGINTDASASSAPGMNRGLSLIVTGKGRKLAILEGKLVKEGDKIDDKRVVRIESDRILLKDKTMQWKYMEEEK